MSKTTEEVRHRAPKDADRDEDQKRLASCMKRIGMKLLVLSGKGGVGKSTVAANLAVALAKAGKAVGLLDTDIHGPSIPQLLGLKGQPITERNERMRPVLWREGLSVISIGFLLQQDGDAVIWRGPRKFGAIRQFLVDVDWGELDYLVVDAPPGTGDEPLSVAQLVGRPAGAVIVTTPQDLAVADVRRCISFCREVSVPIVGIIENMSGCVCPMCGHHLDLFGSGGGRRLAEEADVPFLGRIPFEPGIVFSGDNGTPFVEAPTGSEGVREFAAIVHRILEPDSEE